MGVPLLYFPDEKKCKAFPFRSSKKYLVPERGKVRSFLDIAGFLEYQSPNVRSIEVKFQNLSFHTFKYLEFT